MKVFLLLTSLLLAAFENPSLPTQPYSPTPALSIKYLALGDSYTVGTAIGQENAYPYLLKEKLEKNDAIEKVSVDVIAKNGWTTSNLQQSIEAQNHTCDYDLVTLLIGVNNQYQGKSKTTYRKEFKELLQQAVLFGKGNKNCVFVLSVPDWGVTPSADRSRKEQIAMDIDLFNTINKEVTDSMGVRYFDVTSISREALNNLDLVAKDGLHFSKEMHELWLDIIYDDIKKQVLKS